VLSAVVSLPAGVASLTLHLMLPVAMSLVVHGVDGAAWPAAGLPIGMTVLSINNLFILECVVPLLSRLRDERVALSLRRAEWGSGGIASTMTGAATGESAVDEFRMLACGGAACGRARGAGGGAVDVHEGRVAAALAVGRPLGALSLIVGAAGGGGRLCWRRHPLDAVGGVPRWRHLRRAAAAFTLPRPRRSKYRPRKAWNTLSCTCHHTGVQVVGSFVKSCTHHQDTWLLTGSRILQTGTNRESKRGVLARNGVFAAMNNLRVHSPWRKIQDSSHQPSGADP